MEIFRYLIFCISVLFFCSKLSAFAIKDNKILLMESKKDFINKVEIDDSLTISNIKEYIQKYNLNPQKVIITLSLRKENGIVVRNITYTSSLWITNYPSFFSIIDNKILVLIYSGIEYDLIKQNNKMKKKELGKVIKQLNLEIEKKYILEEPPIWQIESCNDKIQMKIVEHVIPASLQCE